MIGGLGPDVAPWVVVPGLDPGADVVVELPYRGMGPAAQLLGGQLGDPAFDEIEPRELVGVKRRTNLDVR